MKNYLAGITIFVGSFLIFGVQPMVGRTLLPVFGGTAAVWVVCLCAFQVFLLAGYWYADWLSKKGTLAKVRLHVAVLLLSTVWVLVVAFNRNTLLSAISGGITPALDVLVCVSCLVGVPYVLLAANSSLVQHFAGGNYRLYAVSNAGSLLGLLAYPFVFEPYVGLTQQWTWFAVGIGVYAGFLLVFTLGARHSVAAREEPSAISVPQSTLGLRPLAWLLLPAASCFLLNSLTTHVTLDIMPMPLIWTASLGIFLLSYIIGFSGKAEKLVVPCAVLSAALVAVLCWMNGRPLNTFGLHASLGAYGAFLLFACTFLHSWLYALRPNGEQLTKYYLLQSIGGAAGGVAASLAFPLLAKTIAEYPVALGVVGLFAVAGLWLSSVRFSRVISLVALVLVGIGSWLYLNGAGKETRPVVYRGRGFFGTVEVFESKAKAGEATGRVHEYVHGTTVHGIQALLPGKERMPTVYYTPNACGYGIVAHPKYRKGEPMRVNIVGLGVGVMMSYARPGDYYRAYEISADALKVATDTNLFTFVSGCPAKTDVVLGDARKGLEAEIAAGVEPYDVICVDAYTGDNVPYHLSTVEAFDIYFKLLKPDGIIVVNISNWHLNLLPFMRAIGDHYGCPLLGLQTGNDFATLQLSATVAVLCRDPKGYAPPPYGEGPREARPIDFSRIRPMESLPTDEKGSFVGLINW